LKYNKSKIKFYRVLPSVFEGNTFSINLFLFLGILGFFIAGIDLSTELAKEKDEVNFVLDNLEDGCNIPQLSAKGLEDIFRPFEIEIPFLDTYIFEQEFLTSNDNRGPPAA
jgi:hypothetical protein